MLDINKIRDHREEIRTALLKRMDQTALEQAFTIIIELDDKRRELLLRWFVAGLEIGFERSKSRFPSRSIEGMNEETRTIKRVKSINLGIPEIIASSKSRRASSNFP